MRKPPTAAKLQEVCDRWNKLFPVGTAVIVTRDLGKEEETVTKSEAYVMGGHSAVIFLEGVSGCYALDRVRLA